MEQLQTQPPELEDGEELSQASKVASLKKGFKSLAPRKFWEFKAEAVQVAWIVEALHALAVGLSIIDVNLSVLLLFARPIQPEQDI